MSRSEEDRRAGVGLDHVERGLTRVHMGLLAVGAVGLGAGIVWIALTAPPSFGSQGEWFYLGIGALLALGWLSRQAGRLAMRRRGRSGSSFLDTLRGAVRRGSLRSTPDGALRTWEFRLGGPDPDTAGPDAGAAVSIGGEGPARGWSKSFQIPLARLPVDVTPDDAALARVADGLERGEDIDALLDRIQPAYRGWSRLERRAYRVLVESLLAGWRHI